MSSVPAGDVRAGDVLAGDVRAGDVSAGLPGDLAEHLVGVKGFLPTDEGLALLAAARTVASRGPMLEVGTYCGRSAIHLGWVARQAGSVCFSIDHHRGSDEIQPGWEHHDPETLDAYGRMDTLPFARRAIERAGLEAQVVLLVGRSPVIAKFWQTPLAFVFIDGGHGEAEAAADYAGWAPWVAPDGLLAIHDVHPNPADGGRPPYEQIYLPALASGRFVEMPELGCGSLRVLRAISSGG